MHEPEATATAGEQVLHHVLEVLGRRLERRLEALADAAVGVADQPLQLGEGGVEGATLRLELLDVRHRVFVLLLGKWVDRTELLASAGAAPDAGADVGAGGPLGGAPPPGG